MFAVCCDVLCSCCTAFVLGNIDCNIRHGSTVGRRQLPPNLSLSPQMWHQTLFDELKASAKGTFCGIQNTPKSVAGQLRELMMLPQTHIVGCREDTSPYHTPLGAISPAFGACHSAPQLGGNAPKIFFCRTAAPVQHVSRQRLICLSALCWVMSICCVTCHCYHSSTSFLLLNGSWQVADVIINMVVHLSVLY